ncbi:RmlC-like cupin domain-containing protein [Mycena vitilis]|nr:RmlC-like cupin domain-containing protein [Mycena vitilis]
MTTPVNSPTLNPLVKELGLLKHPEGGYFLETDRQGDEGFILDCAGGDPRSLTTSIFYLLDYDSQSGAIHMNKSVGRGRMRRVNVGTGVWKMSRLLPEDITQAKTEEEKRNLGCLITEVVVPGFHWEDHTNSVPDKEALISELTAHLKTA